MVQYRFKQQSVEEQKRYYGKRNKKLRKRQRFWSIILLGICATAGFYLLFREDKPEISGAETEKVFVPAPVPTEINANFINQVNKCFLPATQAYGYNLRITSGFRSMEEQDALYQQGRTVDGHIVTQAPAGKSIHNYGYAIDVVDRYEGFDVDWDQLTAIASFCGLEAGGEGDEAHFEYRGGLTTDDFQQGHRPVELSLPCNLMENRYNSGQILTRSDLSSCGAPDFNLDF